MTTLEQNVLPPRKKPGPKSNAEKAAMAKASAGVVAEAAYSVASASLDAPTASVPPLVTQPPERLKLKYFRVSPTVPIPEFKSRQSACWDLAFCPEGKREYNGFNENNAPFSRPFNERRLYINAHDRILVPTGLFLDIPEGYSVRVHARSGTSLKQGLVLGNQEGVIDSDYIDELFILLYNTSVNGIWIQPGDRLAQAELIRKETYLLWEISEKPVQKTNRTGGFGSTGT